jgi:CIC family chloride channel protein
MMIILSIIIGTLAGFAAVGIRILINKISSISFPGDNGLLENIINLPWYILILVPAIGGLIVGPLIYFFAPEAKGHGVPEVMAAMIQKGGRIRPRVALIKAIASSITIGTGGSAGREGPIIQIGASIGSTLGQFLKLSPRRLKTLVGCGAAAGIAAAFNAPVAGILFALELLLMDFSADKLIPIAISSVISTSISRNIEGNFAAFSVPTYSMQTPYELLFYVLLGFLSGFVSYVFIKALYFSENLFDEKLKIPGDLKPFLGGIILGAIAIFFPHSLGMGYESISLALQGKIILTTSLILIFVKILSTSVTLGSGSSGGIFAPSLFMGAMLGSLFGGIIHYFFPEITAGPGAYALVAMAGLVAGSTRATITAIIIVFEMTADYHIILPLVIVCVISTYISAKLSRESIYTLKLVLKNINIKEGFESNIIQSFQVRDAMQPGTDSAITEKQSVEDILDKAIRFENPVIPVISNEQKLKGVIALTDLFYILKNKEHYNIFLIAKDIMNSNVVPLTPEQNCHHALEKIRKFDLEGLPVVNNMTDMKFIGMIWGGDIHSLYLKEIERLDFVSKLSSSILLKDSESQVTLQMGYTVAEIKIPDFFIGKKISELDIRQKYAVDILATKTFEHSKEKFIAFPKSDFIFRKDDRINIAGLQRNVNILKNS